MQALTAFVDRKGPLPAKGHEVDLEYPIKGQSVGLFEVRRAWQGLPGKMIELPIAETTCAWKHDHWRVHW